MDMYGENAGISRKKFVLAIVLCFVIAFSSGYVIQNVVLTGHPPSAKATANVYVTIQTEMGIQDIPVTNLITDIGENQTATRNRVDDTYVAVKYISLSDDAGASAAWTKLPTEATTLGAERAVGTVSDLWLYSGDAAYNVTKKFTFTGEITLKCAGANWNATPESDDNLYAAANFAETTFQANWNLTITWVFVFDGNS